MSADVFPDEIEARVIEYASGRFAPVVAKGGEWKFTGGRVYGSHEAAAEAADYEVDLVKRFWGEQLTNRSNAVVVNGEHYRIVQPRPGQHPDHRGFGGRTFHLRDLTTGEVITCSNLWRQGIIPDFARALLPNTHEFVARLATRGGAR